MGLLLIFSLYAFSEHSSKQSVLLGCNCSPLMSCSGWQQREAGLGSVCFLRKIPCETWRNGNCRDLDIAYKDIWESEQKCASSECMRHKGCQKQWVLSLHLWQQLDCISCVKQHFFSAILFHISLSGEPGDQVIISLGCFWKETLIFISNIAGFSQCIVRWLGAITCWCTNTSSVSQMLTVCSHLRYPS